MVYGNNVVDKNSTFDYLEDMHLFKIADALTASPSKNNFKTDHYLLLCIGNVNGCTDVAGFLLSKPNSI